MRIFHVSEESGISLFKPRLPKRIDLDQSIGLVWVINEVCLPNFLTPRNCPRVTYHFNTYYKNLQPRQGPNTLKHSLSKLIVDYAKEHTDFHIIICNSNRSRKGRLYLL